MNQLTETWLLRPYMSAMARKNPPPSFDVQGDLRTDYILIAAGVGAAFIALVYLLVT